MSEEAGYVFPWDDSKFRGSIQDKALCLDWLRKNKYQMKMLKKGMPQSVTMQELTDILGVFPKEKTDRPWLLVLSNSAQFLQAIAQLVPVTLILTHQTSVHNTRTEQLMNLFLSGYPKTMFDNDPAGDTLDAYRKCGFLMYENIATEIKRYQTKAHGYFEGFFEKRLHKQMMFTHQYSGVYTSGTLAAVLGKIGDSLGDRVPSMIEEVGQVFEFPKDRVVLKSVRKGGA